jgi:L-cystine transport system substrate-binding protein
MAQETETDTIYEADGISRRSFAKMAGITALGLGATGFLAACGGGDPATASGGSGEGVKELRVAISPEGNLIFEYEEELLRRIDELLPQYTFNYEEIAMTTQLPELASGRIDIGAHYYEDNAERRENYLFTDIPHWYTEQFFWALADNNSINSFEDIVGKVVGTFPSSNSAYALEQWNESHPDQLLELDYVASTDLLIADLKTGKADATLLDKGTDAWFGAQGLKLKQVTTDPFIEVGAFFLLPLGHEDIQVDVNGALKTLSDDGTLERLRLLAVDWGEDPTKTGTIPDWGE